MKPNWPLLALTRFVLACVVYASHAFRYTESSHGLLVLAKFGGHASVLAFLLLSGFSIKHSISRESKDFYARRFWRIYPTAFVCICLAFIPFIVGGPLLRNLMGETAEAPLPSAFFGAFLLVDRIFTPGIETIGPLWSLCVEMVFYAFAPLFLRLRRRTIWYLIGTSTLAYAAQSPIEAFFGTFPNGIDPYRPFCLLCFWLLGWVWADAESEEKSTFTASLMIAIPTILLTFNTADAPYLNWGPITVAATAMMLVHNRQIVLSPKWQRFGLYGGEISYPLYLIHYPVLWFFIAINSKSAVLPLLGSFAGAVVIHHLVDKPLRGRWRLKMPLPESTQNI